MVTGRAVDRTAYGSTLPTSDLYGRVIKRENPNASIKSNPGKKKTVAKKTWHLQLIRASVKLFNSTHIHVLQRASQISDLKPAENRIQNLKMDVQRQKISR